MSSHNKTTPLNDTNEINAAIDKLWAEDRILIGELFSAVCDQGAYIYCDAEVPERLFNEGLIDHNYAVPEEVARIVSNRFHWSESSITKSNIQPK